MTTFAVTSSDQVISSINYLLSNLDTGNVSGNITVPAGTLIADPNTGQITATGNVTAGANVFSYINQWINLRYANNATGSSGFSTLPTNSQYFGVYNSNIATPSTNPAEYVWREVAGGFGTTKTIYYSSIGGRQVQFAAANTAPNSNFVISVANVAIDLDVITTAAGLPGERGPVVMAAVLTTADPTTASSSTLTGWFSSARTNSLPPIGTGLTPVTGDTALFTYPVTGVNAAYEYNGSTWQSAVSQVINGNVILANTITGNTVIANTLNGNAVIGNTLQGNAIVVGTVTGNLIAANTIAGFNIIGNTITGNLIAANTITGNLIAANTIAGFNIIGNTITGNLIAANTITGTNIVGNTITGNLIAANTISANSIVSNSITASQISSSYIYSGNIVSFGATLGSNTSPGYWLQYNTGNARFGGNVSIGDNLTVDGLITASALVANTVNTGQLTVNAATTVLFQAASGPAVIYPVNYYNTIGNTTWPYNTRGFSLPSVAIRPTTEGASNGSSMLITFTAGVQCDTDNQFNLVELWRTGAAVSYSNVFNSVSLATANNSSVTNNEQMVIAGNNGRVAFSSNGGESWGFNAISTTDWIDSASIQLDNSSGLVVDNLSLNGLVTSTNTVGGPSGSWSIGSSGVRLTSGRVLFTGLEVGNVNINNDIGILTGQTVFSTMFRPFNFSNPGPASQTTLVTPPGVFSDIYDMDWGYASAGNATVKNAVFVCTGGEVLTTQFQYHTSNLQVTYSTMQLRNAPTDSNLFSVSCDRGGSADTIWIAVGEAGVIMRSTDSGATWTSITSPTTENLRSVIGFGGEATKRFVAVGDDQTIIMSSDGGVTWTIPTVPATTDARIRNLNGVSFCPTSGTGNAGLWTAVGEGVIYQCDKTSTTWTINYQEAAIVTGDIQRLVYIGSNPDVNTNTILSNAQIIGNTVVSYTYQDTNYDDNNTYQYYLITGNMNSAANMNVRFPSITVQEIKR